MCALLMIWAAISPMLASQQGADAISPEPPAAQKPATEASTEGVVYKNTKYGFTFSLPQSWKGYTIVTETWEGSDVQKGDVERGPLIYIRHPAWTKKTPRQDIPIMVFTVAQWGSVQQDNYLVNGSTIVPNELGRNRKYVFTLPPRANYPDLAGVEEVDDILKHGPLRPIWSK
jgi:hypothetical protein